jgi:hypothetical protein
MDRSSSLRVLAPNSAVGPSSKPLASEDVENGLVYEPDLDEIAFASRECDRKTLGTAPTDTSAPCSWRGAEAWLLP